MCRLFTAMLLALALGSCRDDPLRPPAEVGTVEVVVSLASTPMRTLLLRVSAPDLPAPLEFPLQVEGELVRAMVHVPVGSARTFSVSGIDTSGEEHTGSRTIDVRRGERTTLSLEMSLNAPSPPSRARIAFVSNREGLPDLYTMEPDGLNIRRVTNDAARESAPAWSADGLRLAWSSDVGGSEDLYLAWWDGSGVRRLTEHASRDRAPSWSPDGRHLAFTSDRDGNDEIHVLDRGTGEVRNLTRHMAADGEAAWRPDGGAIVFVSNRDEAAGLYLMDADGENVRRIPLSFRGIGFATVLRISSASWSPDGTRIALEAWTRFGGGGDDAEFYVVVITPDGQTVANWPGATQPSWSPDASQLVFTRSAGLPSLHIADANGGQPRVVHTNDLPYAFGYSAWSPDGSRLLMTGVRASGSDFYIVDPAGSDLRRFSPHDGIWGWDVEWSPTGERLAFARGGGIYVIEADGTGLRPIAPYPAARNWGATWSPDGTRLLFSSDREGNTEVYVTDLAGSYVVNVTRDPGWDGEPSWLPGGQRIGFLSRRSGDEEFYTVEADGTDLSVLRPHPIPPGPGSFALPRWNAHSSQMLYVYYQRGDNYSLQIWSANADGNGAVRRYITPYDGRTPELFRLQWASGGQRFAFFTRIVRAGIREAVCVRRLDTPGCEYSRSVTGLSNLAPVSFSPDASQVAVERDGLLYIIDLETGAERLVTTEPRPFSDNPAWSPQR
jgi:Tol biopolymer transport system component